jgi:CRP-like cAMP-binding protein
MPSLPRRISGVAHNSRKRATSKRTVFNLKLFLESHGLGTRIAKFRQKEKIFSQGAPETNVMYLKEGGVKLTVVNTAGKEAVVEILGPGDFFGVRILTGQTVHTSTAIAILPTTVLVIEKAEMTRALHKEHAFSDAFIANMLARGNRGEEALIDQLFNSSEKRLARTLLLLARYGTPDQPAGSIPKVSQELLAEIVGTTRSRINFFMNKFRKLGFIEYNGSIHVNKSLLTVVLND